MTKRPNALSNQQVSEELPQLLGWSLKDKKLHKEFVFPDFNKAFAFMTAVALKAEKLDHHPEWFNVYNRVVVDLITHECEAKTGPAISELDINLAKFMDFISI